MLMAQLRKHALTQANQHLSEGELLLCSHTRPRNTSKENSTPCPVFPNEHPAKHRDMCLRN